MTYHQLLETVREYFADTSRSKRETKEDLSTLAEECELMADSIEIDEQEG